jgi:hypothetical protein
MRAANLGLIVDLLDGIAAGRAAMEAGAAVITVAAFASLVRAVKMGTLGFIILGYGMWQSKIVPLPPGVLLVRRRRWPCCLAAPAARRRRRHRRRTGPGAAADRAPLPRPCPRAPQAFLCSYAGFNSARDAGEEDEVLQRQQELLESAVAQPGKEGKKEAGGSPAKKAGSGGRTSKHKRV